MVRYDVLEDELVARLSPLASDIVQILPLPENQAFQPPNGDGVHVYIAANQYESDQTTSTNSALQDEKITIFVYILSKKYRGSAGIYAVCDAIRLLFLGFKPTNCSHQILAVSGGFTEPSERADNIWHYMMRFRTTTPLMNDVADSVIADAITKITHYNELGDVTVTPGPANSVAIHQYGLPTVYIIPPNEFTVEPSVVVDGDGNIIATLSPGQQYTDGAGGIFEPVEIKDEDGTVLQTIGSGGELVLENYNIEVFLDGVSQGVEVLPPLTDGEINIEWI